MTGTDVVVDDGLIVRVMKLAGVRTRREAIDFALRAAAAAETGERYSNSKAPVGLRFHEDTADAGK